MSRDPSEQASAAALAAPPSFIEIAEKGPSRVVGLGHRDKQPGALTRAPSVRAPARGPVLGYRRKLDGLRGFAVIIVVVYHVGGVLWPSARSWLLPAARSGSTFSSSSAAS